MSEAEKLVQDLQQGSKAKSKPDIGFKGYWDDAIYWLLLRLAVGVLVSAIAHMFAPPESIKLGLWGAALGWAVLLRVTNARLSFPAWGWVFVLTFAATFGIDVWNISKP